MKPISLFLICYCCCIAAFAHHNKGGTIVYTYLGEGSTAGTSKYQVTVQHYVHCQGIDDEYLQVYLGIFDGASNALLQIVRIQRSNIALIQKTSFNACISSRPDICFFSTNYIATIEVSNNTAGYILSEQECCRADSIVNLVDPGTVGYTNTTSIPGVINGRVYRNNSSPVLTTRDTAVICHNSYFRIDLGTKDPDGDHLTYTFCGAKATGSTNRQPNPPSAPPYSDVPYTPGYSATVPLGSGVTIDAATGVISGIAPADTGQYIIAVCISEIRNGVLISTTKKEVLITVDDCTLITPVLTSYLNCDNYSFHFQNLSPDGGITSYLWDFGVPETTSDTSHAIAPSYIYADTGTYTLKLVITGSAGCTDSTTAAVKVYPGLIADFTFNSNCHTSPISFQDASSYKSGSITDWLWNFDDTASTSNLSSAKDTSHLYTAPGDKAVMLTVQTDKGCRDTARKTIAINDKPAIELPFTDTLICAGDKLAVTIKGTGTAFKWKPVYNIEDANSAISVVYPTDTTIYTVVVTDKSCMDSASIKVNVLPDITVILPSDTAICATDSIVLKPVSHAISYWWSESNEDNTLSANDIKYPYAAPSQTTKYQVVAKLGHCQDKAETIVHVSPYPRVTVSRDMSICYGGTAIVKGITNAAYYNWSPVSGLAHANTLQPHARPAVTTSYILTVKDTFYCPKPVSDTVTIAVIPPVQVHAGNDTTVVERQQLKLLATSNIAPATYTWQPASYLSNPTIYNPVAHFNGTTNDSITYRVKVTTPEGCTGEDNITVYIYKGAPGMYIPTAFTPNSDGLNDVLKPVLAGVTELYYFRVYTRWGQMIFQTSERDAGWDGTFGGKPVTPGTYVFTAAGKDYSGETIKKQGSVVLIR